MRGALLLSALLVINCQSSLAETSGAPAAPPAKESASAAGKINWQSWSDKVFEQAQQEHKLVILDLEAVWCHWCHVMDEKTYSNATVQRILNDHFIAVRVDQDSRPDLSNRYEDYGWPATIFFDSKGTELVKRAGFIPPDEMIAVLNALVKNPTPGPSAKGTAASIKYSAKGALTPALRNELIGKHLSGYDTKYGAWSTYQKFLDWNSEEYALTRAKEGNAQSAQMAKHSLDGQIHLLDPIWGGMYQYSTDSDWNHPHFEKIMQVQAENMRVFSLGYELFKDPKYLATAKSIFDYLKNFLTSPDGAIYTSQNADLVNGKHSDWYYKLSDSERRKHGIPRVDKHIYARENGWAISGMTALYAATGDKQYLDAAERAANWIVANRSLDGGGYCHDEHDQSGPFLGDTLYMGRALLDLYQATGDRQWLTKAEQAADFIEQHFAQEKLPGLVSTDLKATSLQKPMPLLSENASAARFFNMLYHYSGQQKYKQSAENAMRYLSTPEIARTHKILVADILLADREIGAEPVHITILGPKDNADAQRLFAAALSYPLAYKRVEWWDRREGPMPNSDVEYPELPKPAAFGCAYKRCSLPIYNPQDIAKKIDSFSKSQ
jgi:uncharacterized protein YyaL (SSP411 family)